MPRGRVACPDAANRRRSVLTKVVRFGGVEYRCPPSSRYYISTSGPRTLLHREVWKLANWADHIPDGHDIHHTDEDTDNNDPGNLECLTDAEHALRHIRLNPLQPRQCPWCGNAFSCGRKRTVVCVDPRQRYCSVTCFLFDRPPRDFICAECGRDFQTTGYGRYGQVVLYCSDRCGEAARYRKRQLPPRPCAGCGVGFSPKHKVGKYCNRGCAAKDRVARYAAARLRSVG